MILQKRYRIGSVSGLAYAGVKTSSYLVFNAASHLHLYKDQTLFIRVNNNLPFSSAFQVRISKCFKIINKFDPKVSVSWTVVNREINPHFMTSVDTIKTIYSITNL